MGQMKIRNEIMKKSINKELLIKSKKPFIFNLKNKNYTKKTKFFYTIFYLEKNVSHSKLFPHNKRSKFLCPRFPYCIGSEVYVNRLKKHTKLFCSYESLRR